MFKELIGNLEVENLFIMKCHMLNYISEVLLRFCDLGHQSFYAYFNHTIKTFVTKAFLGEDTSVKEAVEAVNSSVKDKTWRNKIFLKKVD